MRVVVTIEIDETEYDDSTADWTDGKKLELLTDLLNHAEDWPDDDTNTIDVAIDGEHMPFSFMDLQSS